MHVPPLYDPPLQPYMTPRGVQYFEVEVRIRGVLVRGHMASLFRAWEKTQTK